MRVPVAAEEHGAPGQHGIGLGDGADLRVAGRPRAGNDAALAQQRAQSRTRQEYVEALTNSRVEERRNAPCSLCSGGSWMKFASLNQSEFTNSQLKRSAIFSNARFGMLTSNYHGSPLALS